MSEKAEQPTEEPTAQRLQKAVEDGQIAFSSELIGGLIVLAGMLFFLGYGRWFFETLLISFRERLTLFEPMVSFPDTIMLAIGWNVRSVGVACLALMLPLAAITLFAGSLQTRFNLTFKPMELKWDKMSPKAGLKRIFSTRALNRGGLSIAKSAAIVMASYMITMDRIDDIAIAGTTSYYAMLMLGAELLLRIGFATAILLVVLGFVDLGFQIWKQKKDLMMTKQEIRDEHKDSDGDPHIKARIRRIQNEMAQKKVVQEVPKATVVITNPTHFAVALRYETGESLAPVVIAKGSDYLAKQIIRVAKENGIAVVERKPIARFLYANVEVGHEIPYELYKAVAEILNYIRGLKRSA